MNFDIHVWHAAVILQKVDDPGYDDYVDRYAMIIEADAEERKKARLLAKIISKAMTESLTATEIDNLIDNSTLPLDIKPLVRERIPSLFYYWLLYETKYPHMHAMSSTYLEHQSTYWSLVLSDSTEEN